MTVERVSAPPGSVALSTDEDNEHDDDDATMMARAAFAALIISLSPLFRNTISINNMLYYPTSA